MAKFYLKQPFNYLNRREIVKLPDWLWRLFMELRLLAGKYDQGGLLESVADCAWELRREPKQIEEGLQALAEVGLTSETPDGWLLVGFAEEQDAATSTERVQEFRLRNKAETNDKRHGNDLETNRFQNETQLKIESELKKESKKNTTNTSSEKIETGSDFFDETKIPKLNADQREFLDQVMQILAPKRFKYYRSIEKLLGLRNKYPDSDLLEAMEWAAGKEMVPGEAVQAVAKAMPSWANSKAQIKTGPKSNGNGNGHKPAADNALAAELARRKAALQGAGNGI